MFRAAVSTVLAVLLSIALAGACRAEFTYQTPAGINPGQTFNVVFFDSIGSGATSANIADYNAAITSAASNIQYSSGTVGSWSIIGATSTVDESAGLFGSNLPVYDLRGNLLASTGGVYQSIGPSPSIDQTGALFPDYPVWTGLISLGIPGNSQYTLGGGFFPSYGLSGSPPAGADGWGGLLGGSTENYSPADIRGLYGYAVFTALVPGDVNHDRVVNGLDISLVSSNWLATGPNQADANGDGVVNGLDIALISANWLQSAASDGSGAAVPEPSTIILASVGALALVLRGRRRRRDSHRRQS